MEELNVVNDTQTPVVEASEPTAGESGMENMQEAEVTVCPQSASDNSRFRKLRLENERLKSENEEYAAREIERRMKEDLAEIQSMDPTVSELEALGEDFADLIAAGVRAPVAFAAVKMLREKDVPPSIGSVDSGGGEKEFYLPNEVDALSSEELKNPKIWQRVRNSMTKW